MKVLLYFKQDEKKYYESARLWQNLSQACAFSGLEYTHDLNDDFDVAHFVSTEHEFSVDHLKANKTPVVISVLYTESDYNGILIKKNEMYEIKSKAKRVLNKANLVLVPSEMARIILKHNGVETPIKVLNDGVNLDRFTVNNLEMSLFLRYFEIKNNNPIVLSTGKYEESAGIRDFYELARKLPDINFFWFGKFTLKTKRNIRSLIKNAPKNLKFQNIVDENIYLSALLNAEAYCVLGSKLVGTVTILDALASNCVIFAKESTLLIDAISNNKVTINCKKTEDMVLGLTQLRDFDKKINQKEISLIITEFSIETLGKNLKAIYELVKNAN